MSSRTTASAADRYAPSREALIHADSARRLLELGQPSQALQHIDQALALEPRLVELEALRGAAFLLLEQPGEALRHFERALLAQPRNTVLLNNRGTALKGLGRRSEALDSYAAAVTVEPGNRDALLNYALSLVEMGRPGDGLKVAESALRLNPADADALSLAGIAHAALGNDEKCLEAYDILAGMRRFSEAARTLGFLLRLRPDTKYGHGSLLFWQLNAGEWSDFRQQRSALIRRLTDGQPVSLPFPLLSLTDDARLQRHVAASYLGADVPAAAKPLWRGEVHRHETIRVAYLSSDIREHAVAYLAAGLFEAHDRRRFHVTLVTFNPPTDSPTRSRIVAAVDAFHDAATLSDEAIATLLRENEIDIAIDLNGLTEGARPGIFARRPAPIQVNYLGYPGTNGAGYFDYILADATIIPPGAEADYAEAVVRLPGAYQINDDKRSTGSVPPTRAACGLPDHGIVFCSFNNHFKINPDIYDVWMRILQRVPGSVLWLIGGMATVERNLRREAAARGVDPQRIVFAPRAPLADHLGRQPLADLCLDTSPYGGHTTTSDALWMGVPVVTLAGASFASRVAASLLTAAGLPELITASPAAYEAMAVELADNPELRRRYRERLAANRLTVPLFDTRRTTGAIEAAYTTMVERLQCGEKPAGFSVGE